MGPRERKKNAANGILPPMVQNTIAISLSSMKISPWTGEGAGYHQVHWNANFPSGIYFYRLRAGDFMDTKKMILLK
jgi:hypothetical protein